MKLVVGLGNPGKKYEGTRHNVGFVVVDELASGSRWKKNKRERFWTSQNDDLKEIVLVKPETFMNESGWAVAKMVRFYKLDLDDVWVIHDDLDIKLGEYKIQKGVGPKMHNGVGSVEEQLRSKQFWRVRVGVDNRNLKTGYTSEQSRSESRTVSDEKPFKTPMRNLSGVDYVLRRFSKEEKKVLDNTIDKVVREVMEKLCI